MTRIDTATGAVEVNHRQDGAIDIIVWCGIAENGTGTRLTGEQAGQVADALYPLIPVKSDPPVGGEWSAAGAAAGC